MKQKPASELYHLSLYRRDCKRCGHLDPDETQKFSACHYTKGNKQCPASQVQIVVVGKAEKYAKQVLAARDRRDAEMEAKVLKLVAKQNAAFKSKFYEILEQARGGVE